MQTVLRFLLEHPTTYALWLDTAATFSAEWGAQILEGLQSASQPAKSYPPASGDMEQSTEASETALDSGDADHPLSPLDRLIVSKVFDLSSAIQAVQRMRKDGFPSPTSPLEQKKKSKKEQDEDEPEPDEGSKMRWAFIVVDSVTPLVKGLLSGVTAEGPFLSLIPPRSS